MSLNPHRCFYYHPWVRWGDARRSDLSVGDLMGTQPGSEHGMWSDDTLASSMGRLFVADRPRTTSKEGNELPGGGEGGHTSHHPDLSSGNLCAGFTASEVGRPPRPAREDLAQSLIQMVSYNIGYISYLVAKINKCRTIFCSGRI